MFDLVLLASGLAFLLLSIGYAVACGCLSNIGARSKTLFSRYLDHIAAEQMRKTRFEIEMYRGLYRYSNKNDEDLPMVR